MPLSQELLTFIWQLGQHLESNILMRNEGPGMNIRMVLLHKHTINTLDDHWPTALFFPREMTNLRPYFACAASACELTSQLSISRTIYFVEDKLASKPKVRASFGKSTQIVNDIYRQSTDTQVVSHDFNVLRRCYTTPKGN